MKVYMILSLLFFSILTAGAVEAGFPDQQKKAAEISARTQPDFSAGLGFQNSRTKSRNTYFKPSPMSDSPIFDLAASAIIFLLIDGGLYFLSLSFILPLVTALAIDDQMKTEQRLWWVPFGFGSTFFLTTYIIMAVYSGLYSYSLGIFGFSFLTGVYLINLIVAGAIFGYALTTEKGRYDHFNRYETYFFISAAATVGTTLVAFFIFLFLKIYQSKFAKVKRRKSNTGYSVKVEFAPEILGLRVRF